MKEVVPMRFSLAGPPPSDNSKPREFALLDKDDPHNYCIITAKQTNLPISEVCKCKQECCNNDCCNDEDPREMEYVRETRTVKPS